MSPLNLYTGPLREGSMFALPLNMSILRENFCFQVQAFSDKVLTIGPWNSQRSDGKEGLFHC